MRDQKEVLADVKPVVIGLTQDPTMLGVPYIAFLIMGAVTLLSWLASDSFWALAMGPISYLILFAATSRDPKILDVLRVVSAKTPRVRNWSLWGGNSYGP
ncbi:type IV secretion system protein VirB3 [Agrobacterium vitis]|uniref:type IV secretion system protein VirB3 n=1 Tax=Allorhizobium ampelinum TaxID=3025782 RepID=UPI001F178F8D|nr:VirB3 family type IV secretion system protein [Allorhizobium ampelinum]MCF1450519.1 type IV secretion system protein VirB3 [Allorhizobium ampelinum]